MRPFSGILKVLYNKKRITDSKMTQSFETKLIAASSAEILKKAKALLKNKCLICAYRDEDGNMNM